jgi:biopolymer transport protein ExbD
MNLSRHTEDAKMELQIAPLIDVVFLLLIYFMVTASLIKKEGDISFILPSNVPTEEMIIIPVEVVIQVMDDGMVEVAGMRFTREDRALNELITYISGSRQIARTQQSPFFVNILPHQDAVHWRIIDVMDACAAAGVESLSFSKAL